MERIRFRCVCSAAPWTRYLHPLFFQAYLPRFGILCDAVRSAALLARVRAELAAVLANPLGAWLPARLCRDHRWGLAAQIHVSMPSLPRTAVPYTGFEKGKPMQGLRQHLYKMANMVKQQTPEDRLQAEMRMIVDNSLKDFQAVQT